MHRLILFCLLLCLLSLRCQPPGQTADYPLLEAVNPLLGTLSKPDFSTGNTYPAIIRPFGMTGWTPQTGEYGWIYQYQKPEFQGIRATHQPSPWMGDYGQLSFFPFVGEKKIGDEDRSVPFSHEKEIAQPNYYGLALPNGIELELTPSERCAILNLTYPADSLPQLLFDLGGGKGSLELFPDQQLIKGISRSNSGGVPDNFGCYVLVQINHPWKDAGSWEGKEIFPDKSSHEGKDVGAFLSFDPLPNQSLELRIGTSFISHEQALQNLEQEIGDKSFAQVQEEGAKVWEKELSKIEIEGADEGQRTTFYTALYRCLIYPREFHEWNQTGEMVHYSPYDGKVHPGPMYVDNGFWDTFRAVHPLFTLLWPERTEEILQALVNTYQEGDWFPKWTSPGYRDVMIGTHAASLFTDAWAKGIRNADIETAYEGMRKDALSPPAPGGPGRIGNPLYRELGYVPSDKIHEATARTLEFAYGDFCVGEMARMLGKEEDAAYFFRSSLTYRNVFDSTVGFMRGREADGSWRPNFMPHEWGGPFTEGSAWHYSWSVMHNPADLIELMGGESAFVGKMDEMFQTPPEFEVGSYGQEIHEMTEMVAGEMGQYAHGNQPIHHVIYLYNYARQPWKSQYWAREVVDRLYGPGEDGLCGDEDNGQMSAWYVFSTLGFYPVCPGMPEYAIGSPRFDRAVLHLPKEKTLIIEASNQAKDHPYIQSASWNGENFSQNFLLHDQLAAGGTLAFEMGAAPNENWGSAEEDVPFSLNQRISAAELLKTSPTPPTYRPTTAAPKFSAHTLHFREAFDLEITNTDPTAEIFYRQDGKRAGIEDSRYESRLRITKSTHLTAIAKAPNAYKSPVVRQSFVLLPNNYDIQLAKAPSPNYPAEGPISLIDGVSGSDNFRDGSWLGFIGNDLEVLIDLQSVQEISGIEVSCLEDQASGIFFPAGLRCESSVDGKQFQEFGEMKREAVAFQGTQINTFAITGTPSAARYLRIIAKNQGKAPDWHQGYGKDRAWLFVDEVSVE